MHTKIGNIFETVRAGRQDPLKVKDKFEQFLAAPELKEFFPEEIKKKIHDEIDRAAQKAEKEKFVSEMEQAIQPLLQLRSSNPGPFEDVQARIFNEMGGFLPLNKRFSYGLGDKIAHFHLAPSYTLSRAELIKLAADGMQKLAEIIKNKEQIQTITGTSPLVATQTFGKLLQDVGFTIGDLTPEEKERYFPNEKRDVKKAVMTRKEFLDQFGQPETKK